MALKSLKGENMGVDKYRYNAKLNSHDGSSKPAA